MTTHKYLPEATLVVVEAEAKKYEKFMMEMKFIPENINGMGSIRNWILNNFKEEIIFMADDDMQGVWCNVGREGKLISNSETISQIIRNTARCAKDTGVKLFGFSQAWDTRQYRGNKPISLCGWVGAFFGVIGREIVFDEVNKLKVDIDYCLRQLLKNRIIYIDKRYAFKQLRDTNIGGNAKLRSADLKNEEIERLKRRWGKYFNYKRTNTGEKVNIRVERNIQNFQI